MIYVIVEISLYFLLLVAWGAAPWTRSFKRFLIATTACFIASGILFSASISEKAEGPEVMGLSILFSLHYFVFLISLLIRSIQIIHAFVRQKNQPMGSTANKSSHP